MIEIQRTLRIRMRGEDVQQLQNDLQALGYDIQDRDGYYGRTTRAAVQQFQAAQNLADTGVTDAATAMVIQGELANNGGVILDPAPGGGELPTPNPPEEDTVYLVEGEVVQPDGTPLPEYIVRAYDRGLCDWRQLGDQDLVTRTNDMGRYRLEYSPAQLKALGKAHADLKVRVYDPQTGNNVLGDSPLFLQARPRERVDFSIGKGHYRGQDEYTRLKHAITPLLGAAEDLHCLEIADVYILARTGELPVSNVAYFVKAQRWAYQQGLPAQVYYGLFRRNLPLQTSALFARPLSELWKTLEQARRRNLIGISLDTALRDQLSEVQQQYLALPDHPYQHLLATTSLESEQQSTFTQRLMAAAEAGEDLWKTLVAKDGFTEEQVRDLRDTFELQTFTGGSPSLAAHLRTDWEVRQPRAVAAFTPEDWQAIVAGPGVEVPEEILPGYTERVRKEAYARMLFSSAELNYPTPSLVARMSRRGTWQGQPLVQALQAYPDFAFEDQRVTGLLNEHPEVLDYFSDPEQGRLELLRLEQLFHLTPTELKTQAVEALWTAGLQSAPQIAAAGRYHLQSRVNGQLARPVADQIYHNAIQIAATSLVVYTLYHPNLNSPPTYAMRTRELMRQAPLAPEQELALAASILPEWSELFGSPDACKVPEWSSVLSPAAYLVDTLDFLQRAVDRDGKNGLDHLLERRPDIGRLQLTQANTETELPHIDIVTETLEQIIAASDDGQSIPDTGFGQTTWDSELLEAQPENFEPAAYELLRQAAYPFPQLPFNLWLAQGLRYLEQMGLSRHKLMQVLPPTTGSNAARIAAEGLEVSLAELQIIRTKEVRPGPLARLWGIKPARGPLVDQLRQVETLLKQAQLEYDDLRMLLNTRYLNLDRQIAVAFTGDACALDGATLANADGSALADELLLGFLDRTHRFLRLQTRLGWSAYELDQVLQTLGSADLNATGLFPRLSGITQLSEVLDLPVGELCSYWADLDTYLYEEKSLSAYEAAFLDPAIFPDAHSGVGLDLRNEVFALTADRADLAITASTDVNLSPYLAESDGAAPPIYTLNTDYAAYVQSATGLTTADLEILVAEVLPKDADGHVLLNLANVSLLYRAASLAHALRISLTDFLRLVSLIGQLPLASPAGSGSPVDTWDFYNQFEAIDAGTWSLEELAYLLLHEADAAAIYGPPADQIDALLAELSTGFAGIEDTADAIQAAQSNPEARTAVCQSMSAALGLDVALLEDLLFTQRPALGSAITDHLILAANPDLTSLPAPAATFHELYERLHKFTLAWTPLDLDPTHLEFVLSAGPQLGWADIAALPLQPRPRADFQPWRRLVDAASLQGEVFTTEYSLFGLLQAAHDGTLGREAYLAQASAWSGWSASDLTYLAGPEGFNWTYPDDFQDETWLIQLDEISAMLQPSGVSAAQAHAWSKPDLEYGDAQSIKQALRLAYNSESWLDVMAGLQDEFRPQQRDALLGYLLNSLGNKDSGDFYAHFLIDPEMEPCATTSRVVLAHGTVQLFIQRILMNLEPTLAFSRADAESWTWRQNYRVWEAARKVFLFPENWMEPELRDDRTVFFREFEDSLLQTDVTQTAVEDLFRRYLLDLDQVSRLEITGMYQDNITNTLHIFGRTKDIPHRHFYRRWENEASWSSWERVDLEIDTNYVIPIVYNGRLYLFWPDFTITENENYTISSGSNAAEDEETALRQEIHDLEKRLGEIEDELDVLYNIPGSDNKPTQIDELEQEQFEIEQELIALNNQLEDLENAPPPPPEVARYDIELGMVWSEYRDGAWSAKTLSEVKAHFDTNANVYRHYFTGWVSSENSLKIAVRTDKFGMGAAGESEYFGYFYFDDCQGKMQFSGEQAIDTPSGEVEVTSALPWYHTLIWGSPTWSVGYLELKLNGGTEARKLLNTGGMLYYAHQYGLGGGAKAPFFFSDGTRTYFARPQSAILSPSLPYPLPDFNTLEAGAGAGANAAAISSDGQRASTFTSTNSHYQNAGGLIVDHTQSSDLVILTQNSQIDRILTEDLSYSTNPNPVENDTRYRFTRFFHPYTCLYLRQLYRLGVDGLLDPDPDDPDEDSVNLYRQQTPLETFDFDQTYDPEYWVLTPYPVNEIDFDPNAPWGVYNWEVFFHIPLLVATRLMENQRFSEARRWFHYFFDPTNSDGAPPQRFWKIKPFYEEQSKGPADTMQDLIDLLEQGNYQLEQQVQAWLEDPFNPFLIARMRIAAYMRNAFMKYLDLLIVEGDYNFYLDTRESLGQATQLYVLAADLLGEKPTLLPEEEPAIYTPNLLLGRFNGPININLPVNPLESLASLLPTSLPGAPTHRVRLPIASGQAATGSGGFDSYATLWMFGIPYNEKLYGYWDVVDDRLFKLRHCMNITGQVRQLPLFQPPIDPALLVQASAAGLDISKVINSLYAPLPNYRFAYMLPKALEFCNEVGSLGAALLAALEKNDAEQLGLLRSSQEVHLLQLVRAVKSQQIEESAASLESLTKARITAEARAEHYAELLDNGLIPNETLQINAMTSAFILRSIGQTYDLTASIQALIPDTSVGATCACTSFGGSNLGASFRAISGMYMFLSDIAGFMGNLAAITGGYARRQEDWEFQADIAQKEIDQLDQQILAAEIRQQIAEKELENHEEQITQSEDVESFLKMKFTNQQLYSWMLSKLSAVYFQAYQLAYQLAKQAEQAFQRDLGKDQVEAAYIQPTYWDSLKKGLLASEQLTLDLKRMEAAYLEQNKREFELTRHISLRQLDPLALLSLKATGTCEVTLPEWLYDLDNPGQYKRRIKHVSLSIPSVAGPYTSVNCTLTLLNSSARISSLLTSGQYARQSGSDDRFRDDRDLVESIVTSSGSNDSGLFEPNLHDERYLPFEGAGAISTWRLELPTAFRQFDYNTITDVILHVRYTALPGGSALAEAATAYLEELVGEAATPGLALLFSLKHDFSTQWHQFINSDGDFTAVVKRDYFPYFTQGREINLEGVQVYTLQEGQVVSVTPVGLNLRALSDALADEGAFTLALPPDEQVLVRDKDAIVFLLLEYTMA